ncbi:NAD(P)-binding protein [Aspergillus sergii]|uniref:NAD(P)-binding protein n=1 Tax=Aspergillus sergii TaxID=1034303 RepID=A0A5N6WL97_9EURO|nr:NAD(P)-binding protein [Aspergillus sergii]
MAILAVSGGTGKLGRAIVEALKNKKSHVVFILARNVSDRLVRQTMNFRKYWMFIIPVDYSNVVSLTKALEEKKIETVISTVPMPDESATDSQLNLIEAAIKSRSTKRFIPSDFGIIYNEQHASVFPPIKGKLLAAEKLRSSGLEYTLVSNGFFMDYYGLPKVKSYLQPFVFAVDIAKNTAAIPGSGTKFDVTYDGVEKLKTFQVTELPSHPPVYPFFPKEQLQYVLAVFGQWTEAGAFNLPDDVTLNKQFPDIKPLSMKELLQAAWKV